MSARGNLETQAADPTVETAGCSTGKADGRFRLLWTIGFSGKRFFSADEDVIRKALKQAVDFLCTEAKGQDAKLTAVSSLARGGDVLFAETIRQPNECGLVQWKCLLPFHWAAFIRHDLAMDAKKRPLPADERKTRMDRAEVCLRVSVPQAEVTSPNIDPDYDEQREEAYLDCGYRTVDEADVLIFLLEKDEIAGIAVGDQRVLARGGTIAVACYALAARRPMILIPVDVSDPWERRTILNDPARLQPPLSWFVDPMITRVVHRATKLGPPAKVESLPSGVVSNHRKSVWQIQQCLGHLADTLQRTTTVGLRHLFRMQLVSCALAALTATVLAVKAPGVGLLIPLLFLAFIKPLLSFNEWWLEHRSRHRGNRQDWACARFLAELCRGALFTWVLPIQPFGANDEEGFPKVKRLIRTLRLLREQDPAAAIHGAARLDGETQAEADIRAACRDYIQERLLDQAKYYDRVLPMVRDQIDRWHHKSILATWVAIILGLTLAMNKIPWTFGHFLPDSAGRWLEAIVIIAPFAAAYCLGMTTHLDLRRRANRYEEMRRYLTRLADTLEKTRANASRILIIEHAERMMIEEQHEWFSVMRNLSV